MSITAALAVVLLAFAGIPAGQAHAAYYGDPGAHPVFGGLNIWGYCRSGGANGAENLWWSPYGWFCYNDWSVSINGGVVSGSNTQPTYSPWPIDLDTVCRWQYGWQAAADIRDESNPYSAVCINPYRYKA